MISQGDKVRDTRIFGLNGVYFVKQVFGTHPESHAKVGGTLIKIKYLIKVA